MKTTCCERCRHACLLVTQAVVIFIQWILLSCLFTFAILLFVPLVAYVLPLVASSGELFHAVLRLLVQV
jgi:hypothetical protein